MKVILTTKVKKLGEIGDVAVVKDGYAKNYLIAKKIAIPYSEEVFKEFETKKALLQQENEKNHAIALESKAKIEKVNIIILENAGENAKLYGSINSIGLANIINDLVKEKVVEKSNIIITTPIKEIGQFEFTIDLGNDVVFAKSLIVARSMDEAKKIKEGVKIEKTKEKKEEVETTENKETK